MTSSAFTIQPITVPSLVLLSPSLVILSPSPVILSVRSEGSLSVPLKVDSAKDLALVFLGGRAEARRDAS